jgi:hypothetical protein
MRVQFAAERVSSFGGIRTKTHVFAFDGTQLSRNTLSYGHIFENVSRVGAEAVEAAIRKIEEPNPE